MENKPNDSGYINYKPSPCIANELKICCMVTGMSKEAILEQSLEQFLYLYKTDPGYPVKATYLDGNSEYARIVAKNEGRAPTITEKPCYILGIRNGGSFSDDTYRIVVDGRIMTVPMNCIKTDK